MSKISKEFSAALAKAQGEIKHAKLDSKNPHFRSDYASLEAHIDNIKPALAKHGLSLIQGVEPKEGQLWLKSQLIFGEEILETGIPLILSKNDMQGLGSAVSYARRYSVAAFFNMGSDDDDGNQAVMPPTTLPQLKKKLTPPPVETNPVVTPQSVGETNSKTVAQSVVEPQQVLSAGPINHAPQSRLDSYKMKFNFGTFQSGKTFKELGIKDTTSLLNSIKAWKLQKESRNEKIPSLCEEFIELAGEWLEKEKA